MKNDHCSPYHQRSVHNAYQSLDYVERKNCCRNLLEGFILDINQTCVDQFVALYRFTVNRLLSDELILVYSSAVLVTVNINLANKRLSRISKPTLNAIFRLHAFHIQLLSDILAKSFHLNSFLGDSSYQSDPK